MEDEKFIFFTRIEVEGEFKVAMRVIDRSIRDADSTLSITILDEVPKGLTMGVHYTI